MNLKRTGICILVIGVFISGSIISNATLNSSDKVSSNEINSILKNSIKTLSTQGEYIEHITISHASGEKVDTYIDRENYLEQCDEYDANGELLSRVIVYDKGSKALSIGKYNGKYEATIMNLDLDVSSQNKELFENTSQIETYVLGNLDESKNSNFIEKKLINSSIIKYSTDNKNLYFDKDDNNFLIKEETIKDGEIIQTIEYEKISKKSKSSTNYFKLTSPVNEKSGLFLKNIEVTSIDLEKDVPLDNAK